MKLSVKALALTMGILWAAAFFLVATLNQWKGGYALPFLNMVDSVYPGYDMGGFGSVIIGMLYAFVDGLIGGAVIAWLYNRLSV
jgi:hypothetical protein